MNKTTDALYTSIFSSQLNRWIVALIVQYTKFVLCFQISLRVFLAPAALACKQRLSCANSGKIFRGRPTSGPRESEPARELLSSEYPKFDDKCSDLIIV